MGGRKWKVFDEDSQGNILYPIHDACLTIVEKISQRNLQQDGPDAPFSSIRDYYESMCRLNLRNTTYPHSTSDEVTAEWSPNLLEYGAYGLEWEHRNYGAADLQNGSSWICDGDWEVCR